MGACDATNLWLRKTIELILLEGKWPIQAMTTFSRTFIVTIGSFLRADWVMLLDQEE